MTIVADSRIDVRDLQVRYDDGVALDGGELRVGPGRICALIGMNGSGKSTLFKAIMGLLRPVRGQVMVDGAVGYVPQSEDVDWAFPVRVVDVVLMGRYAAMGPLRRVRPADRAAVDDAIAETGLEELAHRQIGALSGGQRKRVFLARLLAQEAQVLLLDEPFAGVDRVSEAVITRVLRRRAESGATVLVATHDLAAIPGFADEAALLHRHVLAHGTTAEVLRPELLAQVCAAQSPPGGDASGAEELR